MKCHDFGTSLGSSLFLLFFFLLSFRSEIGLHSLSVYSWSAGVYEECEGIEGRRLTFCFFLVFFSLGTAKSLLPSPPFLYRIPNHRTHPPQTPLAKLKHYINHRLHSPPCPSQTHTRHPTKFHSPSIYTNKYPASLHHSPLTPLHHSPFPRFPHFPLTLQGNKKTNKQHTYLLAHWNH